MGYTQQMKKLSEEEKYIIEQGGRPVEREETKTYHDALWFVPSKALKRFLRKYIMGDKEPDILGFPKASIDPSTQTITSQKKTYFAYKKKEKGDNTSYEPLTFKDGKTYGKFKANEVKTQGKGRAYISGKKNKK